MNTMQLMWELEKAGQKGLPQRWLYGDGWIEETDKAVDILTRNGLVAFDPVNGLYRQTRKYAGLTLLHALRLTGNLVTGSPSVERLLGEMTLADVFDTMKRRGTPKPQDMENTLRGLADLWERIKEKERKKKLEPATN